MINLSKIKSDAESSMSQSFVSLEIHEVLAMVRVVEAAIKAEDEGYAIPAFIVNALEPFQQQQGGGE